MTHLTREELARWRDQGAAEDRALVIGHLAGCESCRRMLAELVRLAPDGAAPLLDPADFVARGRAAYRDPREAWWRRGLWLGLPVAAAAALALLLLPPRPAPIVETPIEIRGGELQAIAPSGDVASVAEFRWASPFAATRYRVTVKDPAGATVLESETTAERLAVSPDTPAFRGGRYAWSVEALDARSRVIAASRPLAFVVIR